MDYERQFESPHKGSGMAPKTAAPTPPPPPAAAHTDTNVALREPATVPERPTVAAAALREPPLYPPPVQRSRCRTCTVTMFRVLVALIAIAMVALSIVGQILAFCKLTTSKEEAKYSVWQEMKTKTRKGSSTTEREMREDNAAEKAFAILSAALSLIACILCFVFVGLWCRYEQERRRESEAYTEAMAFEEEMSARNPHPNGRVNSQELRAHDSFKCDSPAAYPQAFGTKDELYERERERQRTDRDVGIAAFSFLLVAAAASLVTVALMAHFYHEEIADEVETKKGETASYTVGFILFIIALALGVVGFVLLSLPCLTELYLCCGPVVRTPKTPPVSATRSDSNGRPPSPPRRAAAAAVPPAYAQNPSCNPAGHTAPATTRNNRPNSHNNNSNHQPSDAAGGASLSNTQVHRRSDIHASPAGAYTDSDPRGTLGQLSSTQVHPQVSAPPPSPQHTFSQQQQPYVPTMVGTYPEALPGPSSMEHVTLHHVQQDGTTTAMHPPTTQAAWRGDGAASGQPITAAQRAQQEDNGGYGSGAFYTSSP